MQNFLSFLYGVISHWLVLMSGTASIVLLGIIERFTHKQISWKRYVCLMILLVFYASFLAWQDENNMASSRLKELQQVKIEKEKLEQAIPLVKFDHYQWYKGPGELSCDNPAQAINVYFKNKSLVPAIIEKSEISFFMGERAIIGEPEFTIAGPMGEQILTAGEESSIVRGAPEFANIYRSLKGITPGPYLQFKLSVIYRSINSGKRYRYQTDIAILEDCKLPTQRQYKLNDERNVSIPD